MPWLPLLLLPLCCCSEVITRAMLAVPRGSFVPPNYLAEAWVDSPIRVGVNRLYCVATRSVRSWACPVLPTALSTSTSNVERLPHVCRRWRNTTSTSLPHTCAWLHCLRLELDAATVFCVCGKPVQSASLDNCMQCACALLLKPLRCCCCCDRHAQMLESLDIQPGDR